MHLSDDCIKCKICNQIYSMPKLLPCGETVCQKCIPETNEGSFECDFCNESHDIPKNGFFTNKMAQDVINKACQALYEDVSYKRFTSFLDKIESQFVDFKTHFKTSESDIIEHCRSLINEIDLNTEQKITQINNQRDKLINQVLEFEKKSIQDFNKCKDRYDTFCKEVEMCLCAKKLKGVDILAEKDIISKGISICSLVESKMKIESNYLDSVIDEYKLLNYLPNKEKIDNFFLGKLKSKKITRSLFLNFKDQIPRNSDFSVLNTKNERIIISYKTGSNQSMYNMGHVVVLRGWFNNNWHESKISNQHHYEDITGYGIESIENDIYLFIKHSNRNSEIRRYDTKLNLIKTKSFEYNEIISIYVTRENVFVKCKPEFNRNILYCFDRNLQFAKKIAFDDANSLMYFPSEAKALFFNNSYYFFQCEKSITIVDKETKKFVKAINLTLDFDILKVTENSQITVRKGSKIVVLNFEGITIDERDIDGYSQNSKLFLDEDDHLFIVDMNKFMIFKEE